MDPLTLIAIIAASAIFGGIIGALTIANWYFRRRRVDPRVEAARQVQRERAAAEKLKELLANKAALPLSGDVAQLLVSGQYAAAIERIEAQR